jgi:hypothetical protein
VREPASKRVSTRTSVNFEGWRIEEPAIEQSFESDLVEWMDLLVDRDIGHISLEPTWVDKMCWVKISTTTRRPEHSALPIQLIESILLDRDNSTFMNHVITQNYNYSFITVI